MGEVVVYSVCPKCHIAWGLQKVADAKPQEGDTPAQPSKWKCEACYHHWVGHEE